MARIQTPHHIVVTEALASLATIVAVLPEEHLRLFPSLAALAVALMHATDASLFSGGLRLLDAIVRKVLHSIS